MASLDVRVTVYNHSLSSCYTLDASADFNGGLLEYERGALNGCGSATLTLGLLPEQITNRGYWTARNVVEISTGDAVLTTAATAGANKYYIDNINPFTASYVGNETVLAYFWDGSTLTMCVPVTGTGNDSGGNYIITGQPQTLLNNPTAVPAYASGTIVGRRRYAGIIQRVETVNDKSLKQVVSCVGFIQRFNEMVGTFTVANTDAGAAMYQAITGFASKLPELGTPVCPTTGFLYSGSKDRVTLAAYLNDVSSAINNGDTWAIRIGADRVPRLMPLYVSSSNSYYYVDTLDQGVTYFEPQQFKQSGQDASAIQNSVEVLGDTNPATQQPYRAIVQDTVSIALNGEIDATPVTNTACKSDLACASYAAAIVKEQSLPIASNSFRVYTRNDYQIPQFSGTPYGVKRGDVVRDIACTIVRRFDSTGSSRNLVPDSVLNYTAQSSQSYNTSSTPNSLIYAAWTYDQYFGLGTTTVNGALRNAFTITAPTNTTDGGGALYATPNATTLDGPINYGVNVTGSATVPSGVNSNYTYTRWTGYIIATTTGTYIIGVNSDDGANLYVNGVQLVKNLTTAQNSTGGSSGGAYSQSGTIALTAGTYYPIIIEWQNGSGGYEMQLLWTVPGGSVALVPAAQLSTSSTSSTGNLAGSWWNGNSTSWYPNGLAIGSDSVNGLPIDVEPGQVFSLAGYIDATNVQSTAAANNSSGGVATYLNLVDASTQTPILGAQTNQSIGNAGLVQSSTFTIPAGTYQVAFRFGFYQGYVAAGKSVYFAAPILTQGSKIADFTAGDNYATPNIYGLVSLVQTTIDPAGDSWQDVTFEAVQPDANAQIALAANAAATAIMQNTATAIQIGSYCVSSGAFAYTYSGLTVNVPTFVALFAAGSNIATVGGNTFTVLAVPANWVWLNPNNTWTVNQDPHTVVGSILYGIFSASGTTITGAINKAAIGVIQVGVGNINLATSLSAPTTSASATAIAGNSINGMAADAIVTVYPNNVPNTATGLAFFFRISTSAGGNGTWIPYGESNLAIATGTLYPTSSQTVSFEYGDLGNGQTYDFGIAYVSLAGFGPVAVAYSGYVAKTIAIGAAYQIGGTSITPNVTNASISTVLSSNGVNAAVAISFTITNQPVDTSLSRISFWVRQTPGTGNVPSTGTSNVIGSGANFIWSPYGGQPAVGVGTSSPPASGSYTGFNVADLTNGNYYDFGVAFENTQGGESTIAPAYSNFQASTINLPTSANQSIPTALATSGPTITAASYQTQLNQGTGAVGQPILFSIGDWTANNEPGWFAGFALYWRVSYTTTAHYAGALGVTGTVSNISASVQLAAGGLYDIGIAYRGANSTISAIVWPYQLFSISAAAINPPMSIAGTGSGNYVPDAQLAHVNTTTNNEPYWFLSNSGGTNFGAINGNPSLQPFGLFFCKATANGNRWANSQPFTLQAGTYNLSAYVDLINATGSGVGVVALIAVSGTVSSTNPGFAASSIATVPCVAGQAGLYNTAVTISTTGLYCIQVSNVNVSIGASPIYMAEFQVQNGATYTGFVTATPVLTQGADQGTTAVYAAAQSTQLASIGTQVNLVPDSDIKTTPGPNAYWSALPANTYTGVYFNGRNVFLYGGTSTASNAVNWSMLNSPANMTLNPGQPYTMSALADTSEFTSGSMALIVLTVGGSEITRITWNSGYANASGRQSVTFTMPSGYTQVYLIWQNSWPGISSEYAFLGQIQIEQGRVATAYKANDSVHGYGSQFHGAMSTGVQTGLDATGQIINTQRKSSFLNFQASTLNWQGTPVVSYTSTTSSVTITVPASTYLRTDGTTVSVPALSQPYTGLSAGTYHYDVYYVAASNVFGITSYGTSTPTNAQIFSDCYVDGRVNIYANYPATVPSSGSGGGSAGGGGGAGGNSCPAEYQTVLTKECGWLRADEVDVGMHFPKNGGWVRVNEAMRLPTELWRFTVQGAQGNESFDVNDTHAVRDLDGAWRMVSQMRVGDRLRARSGGELIVVDAVPLGPGHFIGFDVDGHEFEMGQTCAHNNVTL